MSKVDVAKKAVRFGLHTIASPRDAKRMVKFKQLQRATNKRREKEYVKWFDNTQVLSAAELEDQRKAAQKLPLQPLVSIILPLYNTDEAFLRACLDSVLAQTYENWQLCIADDASPKPHVWKVVEEYKSRNAGRIKAVRLEQNQHIVGASNAALKIADGEYVALLDHDDLLVPSALFESISCLSANPDADLIYSDEDKVDEKGMHIEPFFKPDWSPDFLRSCNYITHFAVLRRAVVSQINGFRYGTEGAQDWDLFLRFTAVSDKVYHVPKILYSWRKSPTSTAKTAKSKPYAYVNQKRALRDSLLQRTTSASVQENKYLGFWRVRYNIVGNPLVSIVIPTLDNPIYIARCVNSIIEQTSYPNFEIVIVDTGSKDPKTFDFYESKVVKSNRIKIVNWHKPQFNFSSACNVGAQHAKGDYLLFLNNDTKVISTGWIESMLEHAQRDDIGMVGCQLLFPHKNIQHAGVILRDGDVAVHPFYNMHPEEDIFTNIYIANIRNCLAVTAACCMVSTRKFDAVGGFNEKLRVTYNDVDLCLKLRDAGYFNLYTPYARVYHYESVSIGKVTTMSRDHKELDEAQDYMRKKWSKYLKRDPFYNDNFAPKGPAYNLFER